MSPLDSSSPRAACRLLLFLSLVLSLVWSIAALASGSTTGAAREIPIDGPIGPAISSFVVERIQDAAKAKAPLIILRLDTPGGLSESMRDIIKAILASPVPVVGYVAPSGARAASAGTYILYATHIAAMAPATNVGAATPIEMGGGSEPRAKKPENKSGQSADQAAASGGPNPDLGNAATERRKQVNDAVAYIRSLAEKRHRNADWAARAVRQAASLTASEALKHHVIDLIADNDTALLAKIDGRRVETSSGTVTLHTAGMTIKRESPGWRTQLLATITNPTVAYLLFMIGLVGLAAEALNPGATLPGVVGGICLIAALFAFHLLPVSYGGAALILLGVGLFVAEAFVPSFGALGLGGITAVVFGSVMLMDTHVPGYRISLAVIIGIAITALLVLGLMLWLFARSRRVRVETGHEGLVGQSCTAESDFEHEGRVWLHGESWRAISADPVHRDQTLVVTRVDGLTVYVSRPNSARSEPARAGADASTKER